MMSFSIFPIVIWIVLLLFFTSICFAVNEGARRLRRLYQIPCSKCAFFTGNYYLKCTVHPCKALSEEALNCLDYEPISSAKRKTPPMKRFRYEV